MVRNKKMIKLAAFFLLLVVIVIWAMPLVWAVLTSFKPEQEIKTGGFSFLPDQWTIENYAKILGNKDTAPIVKWFGNSMVISCSVAIVTVVIVAITAYGYARLNFKWRDEIFFIIMAISLFPSIINIIPLYQMISKLDWVNNKLAMIVPGLGAVTNIFLVRQFLMGIPKDFDEAAKIDGASEFQIFGRIILPMMKPVLTVVALFSFTASWNDFLWPAIVFNDVDRMPLTAGLQLLQGAYGNFQIGAILAAACLALVPTFILYLGAQRYFMQSLSLNSGIKG